MFNKVMLLGHLSKDIELRYTQSGSAVASTAIAVTRKWKDQSGGQKEETMFIDITFFGRNAEVANQYLTKGAKLFIEGRLSFQQWLDQNGYIRSKHTVTVESMEMLGNKTPSKNTQEKKEQNRQAYQERQQQPQEKAQQPSQPPKIDIDEDEIPF